MNPFLMVMLACIGTGYAHSEGAGKATSVSSGEAVLKPAPSVKFKALDGQSVSLAQYRGKVVLLNFWGTWCGVCRFEIPDLIKLQREYGSKGFTVLGVAMQDTKTTVAPFIAKPQFDVDGHKVAMNYPVVLGSDKVAAKFGGFFGYPDSILISKDGTVVEKVVGAIDFDSVSKLVRKLLRDRAQN